MKQFFFFEHVSSSTYPAVQEPNTLALYTFDSGQPVMCMTSEKEKEPLVIKKKKVGKQEINAKGS
jgi:mevalonate pyrophosphate decarboxylase